VPPLPAGPPRRSAASRPAEGGPPVLRPRRPPAAPLQGRSPFDVPSATAAPVGGVQTASLASAAPKRGGWLGSPSARRPGDLHSVHPGRLRGRSPSVSRALRCRTLGRRCGLPVRRCCTEVPHRLSGVRPPVSRPRRLASGAGLACRSTLAAPGASHEPSDDVPAGAARPRRTGVQRLARSAPFASRSMRLDGVASPPRGQARAVARVHRLSLRRRATFLRQGRGTEVPRRRLGRPLAGLSASPARSRRRWRAEARSRRRPLPPNLRATVRLPSLAYAAPKCDAAPGGCRPPAIFEPRRVRPPRRVSKPTRRRGQDVVGPSGDLETRRRPAPHRSAARPTTWGSLSRSCDPGGSAGRGPWTEVHRLRVRFLAGPSGDGACQVSSPPGRRSASKLLDLGCRRFATPSAARPAPRSRRTVSAGRHRGGSRTSP
jgi:hypothetical protein